MKLFEILCENYFDLFESRIDTLKSLYNDRIQAKLHNDKSVLSADTFIDTDMPILDNLRNYLTFVETIPQIWTDVHDENIMVRLTSVGPQLVITDPVSGDMK
jgi:hypothetical protein